jgi:hypothetical protein
MADKTYQEHLDELTTATAISAQMAVDYLDGDQLNHFTDYLNTPGRGIKNWSTRGVLPLWENITGLIIDRSAQTYQNPPERIVVKDNGDIDEAGTEAYNALLENSNADEVFEDADLLSRLLKTAVVVAQYSPEREAMYFSAVSRHNCDVDYARSTGKFNSILYTGGGIGPNGGLLYHYWDDSRVVDIEVEGAGRAGTVTKSEPNPYGMVPSAVLYDIRPPRAGFWSKAVWEQLINFNNGINLWHTENKFNHRFGAMGALFTNMTIADGQTVNGDAIIKVTGAEGGVENFLEYRKPEVDITQFQTWLDSYRENVGQEWGVNIKTAGEGSADSGFKLVVEELPGLQLRKKRQKPADTFEQDLYQVCLAISKVEDLGLVQGTKLKVNFPPPDLPVNEKEKAEIEQMELAQNIVTLEEIWKKRDPSLTEDDLAKKRAAITGPLPDFGGIVNNAE